MLAQDFKPTRGYWFKLGIARAASTFAAGVLVCVMTLAVLGYLLKHSLTPRRRWE
jgi:hypothetical protein